MTQGDTHVVDHAEMRVAGFRIVTPTSFNSVNPSSQESVPQLWQGFWDRYWELGIDVQGSCIAVATPVDGSDNPPMFVNYLAGVEVPLDLRLPDGFVDEYVPAGRYVHYTHQGPFELLDQSFQHAYLEWLPKSGLSIRQGHHLELYTPKCDISKTDGEMEILIPVD